jgi:hypothetical protein
VEKPGVDPAHGVRNQHEPPNWRGMTAVYRNGVYSPVGERRGGATNATSQVVRSTFTSRKTPDFAESANEIR